MPQVVYTNTLHDMQAYYQDYKSTHARPIAGAFSSLPSTFRLLNLLIFINLINIMLPVDYGYLHNSLYIINWASISNYENDASSRL